MKKERIYSNMKQAKQSYKSNANVEKYKYKYTYEQKNNSKYNTNIIHVKYNII